MAHLTELDRRPCCLNGLRHSTTIHAPQGAVTNTPVLAGVDGSDASVHELDLAICEATLRLLGPRRLRLPVGRSPRLGEPAA